MGEEIDVIDDYIKNVKFGANMTFGPNGIGGWFGNNYGCPLTDTGSYISDPNKKTYHAFDESLAYGLGKFFISNGYKSIGDFGCGWSGYYTKYLRKMGLECFGYDGDHMTKSTAYCTWVDLTRSDFGFPIHDFLFTLETAEHIPKLYESTFIENCDASNRHGIVVSWSNGIGHGHVNCRNSYDIKDIFFELGYKCDSEGTMMISKEVTAPWVRERSSVYVFRK